MMHAHWIPHTSANAFSHHDKLTRYPCTRKNSTSTAETRERGALPIRQSHTLPHTTRAGISRAWRSGLHDTASTKRMTARMKPNLTRHGTRGATTAGVRLPWTSPRNGLIFHTTTSSDTSSHWRQPRIMVSRLTN